MRHLHSITQCFLGVLLISILASCSDNYSAADYFPVDENMNWVYSGYQNNWRLVDSDFIYVTRNSSYEKLDDGSLLLKKIRHDGTETKHRIDSAGVHTQKELLFLDSDEHFDLLIPQTLNSDTTWKKQVRTRLIPEFACGYCTTTRELEQAITVHYTILATDVSIDTPMKTFEDCLLIEGKGIETIDAGDSMGSVEVEVLTREWYAPNVGLVKLVWREQTNEEVLKTGEYQLELKDTYYN